MQIAAEHGGVFYDSQSIKIEKGKLGNPIIGKEMLVLVWAGEDCDPANVPIAIRNWLELAPEERWWLYTMTNAATGNIDDRRGWRKALRYALCENPIDEQRQMSLFDAMLKRGDEE